MTDDLSTAVTDLWRSVASFLPKFVAFLLILLIGYLVAKAIGKVVGTILEKVGFDRAVERGGIKKALATSEYDASDIVGKLVYYALLLFVLQLAFGVFGPNPISELLTGVIAFLPKAVVAIIIIVVASAIAAAVRELITTTLGGLSYGKTLATIAGVFILIAVLATIGGILVVGVGGGLVKPMQQRWETYLTSAENEAPKLRQQLANAPSVKEQAKAAKDRLDKADANRDATSGRATRGANKA